jgi:hypothetical protein
MVNKKNNSIRTEDATVMFFKEKDVFVQYNIELYKEMSSYF